MISLSIHTNGPKKKKTTWKSSFNIWNSVVYSMSSFWAPWSFPHFFLNCYWVNSYPKLVSNSENGINLNLCITCFIYLNAFDYTILVFQKYQNNEIYESKFQHHYDFIHLCLCHFYKYLADRLFYIKIKRCK